MRVKLTQPGYENFTGMLGAVDFEDGQSVYGVSPQQASGILLIVTGELVEAAPVAQEPVAE